MVINAYIKDLYLNQKVPGESSSDRTV